jgi:WD40 repeat protein
MLSKYAYIASVGEKLLLHNPENPNRLAEVSPHQGKINCCSWSHNGKYFATGGEDCTIAITSATKLEPHCKM